MKHLVSIAVLLAVCFSCTLATSAQSAESITIAKVDIETGEELSGVILTASDIPTIFGYALPVVEIITTRNGVSVTTRPNGNVYYHFIHVSRAVGKWIQIVFRQINYPFVMMIYLLMWHRKQKFDTAYAQ